HHPREFVEAVEELFGDVVAAEPREVEPVADLPLHVAPLRRAAAVPQTAGDVGALQRDDVADRAVVHAADELAFLVLVAVAEPRHDREALLARELARGANAA